MHSKCSYNYGACMAPRALKRNGQPHRFCDGHRLRFMAYQQKSTQNKIARRVEQFCLLGVDDDAGSVHNDMAALWSDEKLFSRLWSCFVSQHSQLPSHQPHLLMAKARCVVHGSCSQRALMVVGGLPAGVSCRWESPRGRGGHATNHVREDGDAFGMGSGSAAKGEVQA
jgi:hypothetical protein